MNMSIGAKLTESVQSLGSNMKEFAAGVENILELAERNYLLEAGRGGNLTSEQWQEGVRSKMSEFLKPLKDLAA